MAQKNCPICKSSFTWIESPYRPFCSKRCRAIDLGAWVDGDYVIPGKGFGSETSSEDTGFLTSDQEPPVRVPWTGDDD